jgi:hypothetical protein
VAAAKPAPHPFADDPESVEHDGQHRCAECGLPKANQRHTLPDVPAQAEHRRRAGEHEGEQ